MQTPPDSRSPDYYADLVRRAAPHLTRTPDETWMQRLDAEQDALSGAFEQLRGFAAAEFAVGLWRWCLERGRYSQAVSMLLEADATHGDLPLALKTEACYAVGLLFLRMGRYGGAERYLNLAAQLAAHPQSTSDAALIKYSQGILLRSMGRLEESEAVHHLSLQWWRDANDIWGMATAHMGLGVLMWMQERLAEAQRHLSKSAKLYQQINDKRQAAKVLNNLANVAKHKGDYRQASKGYRQSLFLLLQLGDRQGESLCLHNLGLVQAQSGDFANANASLLQGISIMREIGLTASIVIAIASLAEVAQMQEDHRRSVMLYGAFEALSKHFELVLPQPQQLEIAQNLAQSCVTLGPQIYGIFWKRGMRMTLEAVLKTVME
jgi:tetratricopeptide (TPR) repeat protein